MKKFILVLTIFLAIGSYYFYSQSVEKEEEELVEDVHLDYYEDLKKGIKVVFIDSDSEIRIYYDPNLTQNVLDLSKSNNYKFAINGGFFTEENTHAGLLVLNSKKQVQIAPNDTQLTHVVDLSNTKLNFYLAKDFSLEGRNITEAFQTGPLILDSGVVQNELIENSLNGEGEYLRSVLGQTETGEKFFLIATDKISLKDLANEIKNIPRLKDRKITAINLDGGSSVTLFTRESEEDSYATFKKLPMILYVE